MEPYEYWMACLIDISFLATIIEIALASTKTSLPFNQPLLAVILGVFTAITCCVTARQWRKTAMHRKGTQTPQVILSVTLCILNCLFALAWLIVSIILYVFASKLELPWWGVYYQGMVIAPGYAWGIAFLAYIISGLIWAQFGLCIYYRRQSLKRSQSLNPPNPQPAMLVGMHTRWILGLIIVCMILCYIDFGLAFGDTAYGGYSIWLIPVGAFWTGVVHSVTLPVWSDTAKKRRGTINPPFIYSITLSIFLCLLALFWFITSIISFLVAANRLDIYKYVWWSVYYGDYRLLIIVQWIESSLALLISCMLWAQFGLIVHYRRQFLQRVSHARSVSESTAGTITAAKANQTDRATFNTFQRESTANVPPYTTQYQPPALTPSPTYSPAYPFQQLQPIYVTNSVAPLPLSQNPIYEQTTLGYNPVFQPSSPVATISVNPMFQKDEGK